MTGEINGIAPTASIAVCCGKCFFFAPIEKTQGEGGECHRNPPSVVVINKPDMLTSRVTQTINTVFPPVPIGSWCGGFVPHPPAEPPQTVAEPPEEG